ncbi:MAG: WD40-repeat-containing domain protein [Linnemannia gamsii]|nr:MAG: WD40-repeat-containing domain protein [Linnemannia gamsii]
MSNKRRPNDSPDEEDSKRYCLEICRPNPQLQMLSSINQRMLHMKTQCLVNGRPPHNYIPALGKATLNAPDYSAVPLLSTVMDFLDGKRQVLLLMGDSGSGKTYFLKQLEIDLWEQCRDTNGPIPIFVRLSSIQNPLSDLMDKVLKDKFCNPIEIRAFKNSGRQFILICDEYDEIPATGNIYNRNKFNQHGRWRVKLIIACRSYKLGNNPEDRFQPLPDNTYDLTDLGLFQMVTMAPFTRTMIEAYVEKYVSQPSEPSPRRDQGALQLQFEAPGAQVWSAQDYMDALTDIPNLMELVENPYILSFMLRLLPTFDGSTRGVSKSDVSLDAVYKHIFDNWMEAGKQRLFNKDKSEAESAAFEEIIGCGFEMVCMEYLLDLAVAIFKYQNDVSSVEYKPRISARWKAVFFGTDTKSKLVQESVPLTRSGSSYRLIHTSLLDYLYSLAVFNPNSSAKSGHGKDLPGADDSSSDDCDSDNIGWSGQHSLLRTGTGTALRSGSEPRRAQLTQRRSTVGWGQLVEQRQTYEQGQVLDQSKELALALKQAKVFESVHKLGITNIAERSMAIQVLADRVRNNLEFKHLLINWVQESRTNETDDQTLAANAMTILVRSGVRFNSSDLRGIKIKGANLTGGDFDSADLRNSDLREVIFDKCWLRKARLEGAQLTGARFGESLLKLQDIPITSAYSRDGRHFAVAFGQGSIRVCNTTKWDQVTFLEGFTSSITSVAFSPVGEQLAFGGMDGRLRTWVFNETLMTPVLCDDHTDCISDLVYSPDGQLIATACQDGIARILDASSGQCVKNLSGHLGGVSSVAFSPDAKLLVSGSSDKTIRLWDVGTGQLIRTLEGHENAISKVLFSSNEIHIASSSFDKTVRIWSATKGDCETTLRGHSESVISIAYSPCGNRLVSSSEDGTIRMWNPRSGSAGPIFQGHTDHVVSVAYSPDGKQFATCGRDMELRLWDCRAATKGVIMFGRTNATSSGVYPYSTVKRYGNDGYKTIRPTLLRRWVDVVFDSFPDRVTNVTVSPDGTLVASASRNVVNVRSKATQRQMKGHAKNVNCIVFSPDPQLIASGSSDKTTRIWNAHSGALVIVLEGHKGAVTSIAFSSAGHQIVTGSKDGTVRLWNLATGEALNIFGSKVGAEILSVAFSSNGKWIASGGEDGAVRIWDAIDYKETPRVYYHGGVINCTVFSPDNIHIASGGDDGTISIWNMDAKDTERVIRNCGAVRCLAYSPTGENIATGGNDQYVRIWNAETGTIDSALDHSNSVLSLCYSTDGTQLWTGSADSKAYAWSKVPVLCRANIASAAEFSEDCREVAWSPGGKDAQLWNVDSGVPKSVLRGHTEGIERVSFSPVHNIIATASRDGTVKLWDSQTEECLVCLKGDTGEAAKIMFSPNGMQIAMCSGMRVCLWNLSITKSEYHAMVSGQCTPPQPGRSSSKADDQSEQQTTLVRKLDIVAIELATHVANAVTAPMFSPDGNEVSVGTADEVVMRFDTQSGEALTPLGGYVGIVTCIDYSLLGDMIATGGEDKTARIWSREKGELKLQLSGHKNRITTIAFSPCSKDVATGSADSTIRLWSSSLHGPCKRLAGEGGSILCLAYSPDGRFLISGCENRLMHLWDPSTYTLLTTVGDFMAGVKSIRWKATPGGLVLLTGCDENPLRLWELVEGGRRYMIQSRWGARVDTLAVFGASIRGSHGLDFAMSTHLLQMGAMALDTDTVEQTSFSEEDPTKY